MPKNKTGGKKSKKGKNQVATTRQIDLKDELQEYAKVTKMLGNGRVKLSCFDGQERLGIIRGKMRKRVWINVDEIVLVSLRDFENNKCDIIGKYTSDDVRRLKQLGELPENLEVKEDDTGKSEEEADVEFNIDDV